MCNDEKLRSREKNNSTTSTSTAEPAGSDQDEKLTPGHAANRPKVAPLAGALSGDVVLDAHSRMIWRAEKSEDFSWSAEKEPHLARRAEIIEKYPEVKDMP